MFVVDVYLFFSRYETYLIPGGRREERKGGRREEECGKGGRGGRRFSLVLDMPHL